MLNQNTLSRLKSEIAGQVRLDEPMSAHTSFHIGGPADALVIPADLDDVRKILRIAREEQTIVLKLGNALKHWEQDGATFVFDSGISLAQCCRIIGEAGYTGMEFAVGIPGSLGGAVFMNAGAYDGEMKDTVVSVQVMTRTGEIKTLDRNDLDFSYRHSALQNSDSIVLTVTLRVNKGDKAAILAKMDDFSQRRISKQPLDIPSAGSTFKRPEGRFVGQMVEQSGLKGFRIGGAEVSVKHAGFIVNADHATAADVLQLIEYIRNKILEDYNVALVPEVLVLGEE